MMTLRRFYPLIGSLLSVPTLLIAAPRVTVSAGDYDRRETPVSFPLEVEMKGGAVLRAENGDELPVQIREARAHFILPELARGESRSYELLPAESPEGAEAVEDGGEVKLQAKGREVAVYHAQPSEIPGGKYPDIFRRGGYLHPLKTPAGRVVTGDYPKEHPHHHGVWFAWTKTSFQGRNPDFWNMGDGTGTVEPVSLDETWSGPVHSGFVSKHRFVDLSAEQPVPALEEQWQVQVYSLGGDDAAFHLLDLTSTQTCAGDDPLELAKFRYGGIGLRGLDAWNGKKNVRWLTSNGETDADSANGSRANWCYMGGMADGGVGGVAVLSHPENFRHPQPLRTHPAEPFLCFAPSQAGEFEIRPGEAYVSRYRYVVLDGEPDADEIDRLWNDYANPPEVVVKP